MGYKFFVASFTLAIVAMIENSEAKVNMFELLIARSQCMKTSTKLDFSTKTECNIGFFKSICANRKAFSFGNEGNTPALCNCVEQFSSTEQIRKCTQKVNSKYCEDEENEEKFKCQVRERCGETAEIGEAQFRGEAQKECVSQFCEEPENENKLECLALYCNDNYFQSEKFYCLKIACTSHGDRKLCKRLDSCEQKNLRMHSEGFIGMMAKLGFAKCFIESKLGQNNIAF